MKLTGKIAAWFWIILILGNAVLAYMVLYGKVNIGISALGLFLFNLILIPIVLRNHVVMDGVSITVCFGFYTETMRLKDITHVYETTRPEAATAASLDRIVIKGKDSQRMVCSVEEKERLMEALRDSGSETLRIEYKKILRYMYAGKGYPLPCALKKNAPISSADTALTSVRVRSIRLRFLKSSRV